MRIKNYKLFESEKSGKSVIIIQIDSRKRSVNLVQVNNWNWSKVNRLIGHNCRLYNALYYYDNEDTLYVDKDFSKKEFDLEIDQSGIYNPADYGFIFTPYDANSPIWGNGVIIGSTDDGVSLRVKSILNDVRKDIIFLEQTGDVVTAWNWDGKEYVKHEHS